MTCLDSGTPEIQAYDPETPPAGTAFYYLVSAANACSESYAGLDSDGSETYPSPACDDGSGDSDGDGVLDPADNCVFTANPDQADTDDDGTATPATTTTTMTANRT